LGEKMLDGNPTLSIATFTLVFKDNKSLSHKTVEIKVFLKNFGSGSGLVEVITDLDPVHWIVPSLFCLVVYI
jgi:hypothetical protein